MLKQIKSPGTVVSLPKIVAYGVPGIGKTMFSAMPAKVSDDAIRALMNGKPVSITGGLPNGN